MWWVAEEREEDLRREKWRTQEQRLRLAMPGPTREAIEKTHAAKMKGRRANVTKEGRAEATAGGARQRGKKKVSEEKEGEEKEGDDKEGEEKKAGKRVAEAMEEATRQKREKWRIQKQRERLAMPEPKKEAMKKANAAKMRERRANMSEEEKAEARKRNTQQRAQHRAALDPEKKAAARKAQAERQMRRRARQRAERETGEAYKGGARLGAEHAEKWERSVHEDI